MPNGCTLLFEPFVASSVHEPLGLVPGNIYGQSTEAIDVGEGACKHLLARPTFAESGDIVAMTCNCPDGSVIKAEPTWTEAGDVVWQEVQPELCVAACKGHDWPCFLTLVYPCTVSTPFGNSFLTASPDWATAPQHTCEFVLCDLISGAFYDFSGSGIGEHNTINIRGESDDITIGFAVSGVRANGTQLTVSPRLAIESHDEASALLLSSSESNPIELPWVGNFPVSPNVLIYASQGPLVPYVYCASTAPARLHYTDDLAFAPSGCVFVCD